MSRTLTMLRGTGNKDEWIDGHHGKTRQSTSISYALGAIGKKDIFLKDEQEFSIRRFLIEYVLNRVNAFPFFSILRKEDASSRNVVIVIFSLMSDQVCCHSV